MGGFSPGFGGFGAESGSFRPKPPPSPLGQRRLISSLLGMGGMSPSLDGSSQIGNRTIYLGVRCCFLKNRSLRMTLMNRFQTRIFILRLLRKKFVTLFEEGSCSKLFVTFLTLEKEGGN